MLTDSTRQSSFSPLPQTVVRCFEDSDIIHVEGSVDPVRDIDIINIELALADMAQVSRGNRVHGRPHMKT